MGVSFEVNNLPGSSEKACLHLHFMPDALAVSIFKQGDTYILRPETGVSIRPDSATQRRVGLSARGAVMRSGNSSKPTPQNKEST